ncbi:hypothetical protein N9L92_03690 [Saprospiraceae bacterium]|nr:hypothetical protein [Saprospiraceae bacterium]
MKIRTTFHVILFSLGWFALSAQCPGGPGYGSNQSAQIGGGNSASITGGGGGLNVLNQSFGSSNYQSIKSTYASIDGNPYLNNEPIEGTLVMVNGMKVENVPLQIDLYSHLVIATNDKGVQIILDGKYYEEVIMPYDGQDLVFKKANPNKPDQYYEVLYDDGEMTFFKEGNVRLNKSSSAQNSIANLSPSFNKSKTKYFIRKGDQDVVNVKLKKKDIFSMFPDSELIAMKDYAKRKGIKFKDEADYVAMFDNINSLKD